MNSKFLYSLLSCILLTGFGKTSAVEKRQAQDDPCDCGRVPMTRIIGGEAAAPGEIPWRVALTIKSGAGESLCGGTIIHRNWVLTAAHCVDSVKKGGFFFLPAYYDDVNIIAGNNNRSAKESTTTVSGKNVKVHPEWNRRLLMNDIALIEVPQGFDMSNPRIAKSCLPYKYQNEVLQNKQVLASGWGTTQNGGAAPTLMRKAILNMFEYQECNQKLRDGGKRNSLDSTKICTKTADKDICQGDSGGSVDLIDPARSYALGINSYVIEKCANPDAVSVMTKIAKYLPWIESVTKQSYCKQ